MKAKERDHAKFAEMIKNGSTIRDALLASGASPAMAKKGKEAITRGDLEALHAIGIKTAQLGQKLTPDFTRQFIRGKAYEEAIKGKDTAQMLKLLGQDRDVQHFTPENQTGIIVIQMPESLAAKPDPMQLEATEVLDLGKPKLLGS